MNAPFPDKPVRLARVPAAARDAHGPSEAPIALIAFRRPETTYKVLNAIRAWQPRQLHLICDGPRNDGDLTACKETRAVLQNIDWECDVRRDYSEKNLGLRERVRSGLSNMFQSTDRAIVLEDDCLPAASFSRYCNTLLDRYEGDNGVGLVSGDNAHGYRPEYASYYFSRFALIWGWATWARSWRRYDIGQDRWADARDSHFLYSTLRSRRAADWWTTVIEKNHDGGQSWATVWLLSNLLRGALCAVPSENQISNIGFGEAATHTTGANALRAAIGTRNLPTALLHPRDVVADDEADRLIDRIVYTKDPHFLRGGPGVGFEQIQADAMRGLLRRAGASSLACNFLIATYFRQRNRICGLRRDRADHAIFDTREALRVGRIDIEHRDADLLDEVESAVDGLMRDRHDLRPWPAPSYGIQAPSTEYRTAVQSENCAMRPVAVCADGEIIVRAAAPFRRPLVSLEVDGEQIDSARGSAAGPAGSGAGSPSDVNFQLPRRFADGERHSLRIRVVGDTDLAAPEISFRLRRWARGEIAHYSRDGEISGLIEVGGLRTDSLVCRLVINGDEEIPFILGREDLVRSAENGVTKFTYRLRLPTSLRDGRPIALALVLEDAEERRVLAERAVVLDDWQPTKIGVRKPVRTLTIVEPTLTGDRGHMLAMTQLAIDVAHELGLESEVFSHKSFKMQAALNARVTPHFQKSPYEIASLGDPAEIDRRVAAEQKVFLGDLSAMTSLTGGANRLFFYPTVNEFFVQSIAQYWSARRFSPGEHHLVCLMLETGMVDRDGVPRVVDLAKVERFRAAFEAIEDAGEAPTQIAAVSATHARHYQMLTSLPIISMPTFFGRSSRILGARSAPSATVRARPEVILYLGEAKANKGFCFVPHVVSALRAAGANAIFHVQIHNASSYPDLDAAAQEIRAMAGDDLRIWEGFLPRVEYLKLMDIADVVVLAYDPARYAGKTSGVFWEAQSFAIPVVVPSNTWLECEARHCKLPHQTYRRHDPNEIVTSIMALLGSGRKRGPARIDAFEEVKNFFRSHLEAKCGGSPMTFGDLFSDAARRPPHDQATRSFRAAASAKISADDGAVFLDGWTEPIATDDGRRGRWMSSKAELELLVDRQEERNLAIEVQSGRAETVKVWIDGELASDARLIDENQNLRRLRARLPRQSGAGALQPTRITLSFPEPSPGAASLAPSEHRLLVNSIWIG